MPGDCLVGIPGQETGSICHLHSLKQALECSTPSSARLNHFPGWRQETCESTVLTKWPSHRSASKRTTQPTHNSPDPPSLPAAGRAAGGDILHEALLHAGDPGGAVGVVGCQHHAARVLHLHGHRHMSVTKAAGEGSCHASEHAA